MAVTTVSNTVYKNLAIDAGQINTEGSISFNGVHVDHLVITVDAINSFGIRTEPTGPVDTDYLRLAAGTHTLHMPCKRLYYKALSNSAFNVSIAAVRTGRGLR